MDFTPIAYRANSLGVRVYPKKLMKYDTNNNLLKQLGKDTSYDIDIDHYAFWWQTTNEASCEMCVRCERYLTNQEHNRILGHLGTQIFEKYYNNHFIHQDIQSIVLLCLPQAQLVYAIAQMDRNRDLKAPKDLTDEQRQILYQDYHLIDFYQDYHLIDLRKQRDALR